MKYIRVACVILIVILVAALVSTLTELSDAVEAPRTNDSGGTTEPKPDGGSSENTGTETPGENEEDNTENETPGSGSGGAEGGEGTGGTDGGEGDIEDDGEKPIYDITTFLAWSCGCTVEGYPKSYTFPDDLDEENIFCDSDMWEEGSYRYYAYINVHCVNCGESCGSMIISNIEKIS